MTFQLGGGEQKEFLDFGFRGGLKVSGLEGKEIGWRGQRDARGEQKKWRKEEEVDGTEGEQRDEDLREEGESTQHET